MSMPEGHLLLDEVAIRVRRTPMTVRRWCKKGMFAGAFKDGPYQTSRWYIPEKSVNDYLESLKPKTKI